MGQNEQGLLLHVQDAISVDPGIRRKGHIDEQRDRHVVTLRAHREMDAIERAAAGAKIAARAHQCVYVEIVPVGLRPHEFVAGPQRFELPPHLADPAAHGLRPGAQFSPVSLASAVSTRQ